MTTPVTKTAIDAVKPLVGLASLIAPGWFLRESMKGAKDEWVRQYENHHVNQEYADMQYGWGHYSGNPTMDHWAHRLFRLKTFGPWGTFTTLHRYQAMAKGFFNDVFLKNLVPIGLGVAGVYAGFGAKTVNKALATGGRAVADELAKLPWGSAAKKGAKGLAIAAAAPAKGLLWSLQNGRAVVSLPVLSLLGFGAHRFNRVVKHEEQGDFFRSFTNSVGH